MFCMPNMDIKLTLLNRVKRVGQKEKIGRMSLYHCCVLFYLVSNEWHIVPELEYFIIICHSTERLAYKE